MMKKRALLSLMLFIWIQACKTDFDVNAPWRDITVVYGLLDQNEYRHVVKVNKAFLAQQDVNEVAQMRDSSEYGPDEITVTLERSVNGSAYGTYTTLSRVEDTLKPGGTFYAPNQVLYIFNDSMLNPDYEYQLVVTNNETQKKVYANTKLIQDFKFSDNSYWKASTPKVSFFNNGAYQIFKHAKWNSAVNGRRYQLTVRFHYREKDKGTGVETEKSLDWTFPGQKAPDLNGGDEIGNEIDGEDFYRYVATKLVPVSSGNNVIRCIGTLDFTVSVGGEDFNTYLEVNEPSTGIVQERPEFTNVYDDKGNEQAGFFSARYSISEEGAKLGTSGINGNSVTELKTGKYTGAYGFVTQVEESTCPAY